MKAYFLKAYSLSKIHGAGQIKSPVVILLQCCMADNLFGSFGIT